MSQRLAAFVVQTMQILSPLLLLGLALIGKKLHDLIAAKVKNEKLNGILNRLDDAAVTAVAEIEQTVVSKLDPTKPLGETAAIAKQAALDSLKTHLGAQGIAELKTVMGLDDAGVEKVLSARVEAEVAHIDKGGTP
jgi:hypothetical protein